MLFRSEDGTILSRADDGSIIKDFNLMIIKGVSASSFTEKNINPALLARVHQVMEPIQYYFFQETLQVEFKDENNLVVFKDDTLPILIGTLDNLDKKFKILKAFLATLPPQRREAVRYVDLRVSNKAFVNYGS